MEELKMPFTSHLVDLRKRIIISLVFVVTGFAAAFNYSEDIFRFLTLPVIFSQVWHFISPGLLHKEKKYVVPFVFITTTFFIVGAAYCFFLVLPFAMGFLLTYKTESMIPMISVEKYVDFF